MPQTKHHGLKTWPEPFAAVANGRKTFEFRKNDRDFREGDNITLWEWDPAVEQYTGRAIMARIGYVLDKGFEVPEGFCVFTLKDVITKTG